MELYAYDALLTTNGRAPQPGAVVRFFAESDTSYSNPLEVFAMDGRPIGTAPKADTYGYINNAGGFKLPARVAVAKSGALPPMPVYSMRSVLEDAKNSATSAEKAQAASEAAHAESEKARIVAEAAARDAYVPTEEAVTSALTRAGSTAKASIDVTAQSAAYQTAVTVRPYLAHEERLSKYIAALRNASTAPVNIYAIGDSITEGSGSSVLGNRWLNRLQDKLRYRHGNLTGAEWPFIPAMPHSSTVHPAVTRSGAVTESTTTGAGLGWRTAILGEAGALTFTFTGTACRLAYFMASGTGTMSVQIDGASPVIVDTNSVRTGNPSPGLSTIWASPALSDGEHTVIVRRTDGNVYVQGLFTYRNDAARGIRVVDAARHGITSGFFTQDACNRAVESMMKNDAPALLIIAVGTNDYGNAVPPETYKANVLRMITTARAKGYAGTVVLVNAYKGGGRDEATWRGYYEKLYEIAKAEADVAVFDWRGRIPDATDPDTDPAALGLFNGTVHLSDRGNEWIARVMADYLSDRA